MVSEPLVLPVFKHNRIGTAVPSLVEESSPERLRRQAQRAVMRQRIPLHLSNLSLSEGHPPAARYAED